MKWEPEKVDDEPDLTPMIDIVFLLIVFFMTVANIATAKQVEIDVPIADKGAVPDSRENRDVISVLPDGSLFFGATPTTLDELKAIVTVGKSTRENYQLLLRVDASTEYLHTRDVMEACSSVGVIDIVYATYQSDK